MGIFGVDEGSKIVNIKGYRLDVLNAIKGIRPSAFYSLMGVSGSRCLRWMISYTCLTLSTPFWEFHYW